MVTEVSQAQAASDIDTTERLCGLCKLWGALKYFHPSLAYKDIDWDTALVQTIPRVKRAASVDEYRDAVASLLAALDDPHTRLLPADQEDPSPLPPEGEDKLPVRWTEDGIAIIDASEYERCNGQVAMPLFYTACAETKGARARVFDLRRSTPSAASWFFCFTVRSTFSAFLDRPLQTSSIRHRMHSGYQPQAQGYVDFYSGMVTRAPATVQGSADAGAERFMVFLINEHSAYPIELLGGLQAGGRGAVVRVGEPGEDWGVEACRITHAMPLPGGLRVQMRVAEVVNPDRTLGFFPDRVVPSTEGGDGTDSALEAALEMARAPGSAGRDRPRVPSAGFIPARPENPYREMEDPLEEYRLLALFRFWNVVHYFFPYKELLDRPWEEVLPEFIPRFQAAEDGLAYVLTAAELAAQIQDTHGFVQHPRLRRFLGTHHPPVQVKTIQGETVVTAILPDGAEQSTDLEVGDVVLAADGEAIEARRTRLAPLLAVSTPQALCWRLNDLVLAGPEREQVTLTVRSGDGTVREVGVKPLPVEDWWQRRAEVEPKLPVFTLLTPAIGYIDLTRLTLDQVDTAFEAVKDAPALIMDVRGYPRGTFQLVGSRLAREAVTVARFRRPEWHGPSDSETSTFHDRQTVEPGPGEPYRGTVVALINEEAISQAEHTCLYLEAAAGATFIGSPTNGANGDVTTTVLPGGIVIGFSGHNVRHGDGRQLQRVGIQPHIHVEPTVEGIREGRDEVLEAAVGMILAPG